MGTSYQKITATPISMHFDPPRHDAFTRLIRDINDHLGPSHGIDSDGVSVEELQQLMKDYSSTDSDWQRYAFADPSRNYTRNLVDCGNGKANLLVLVWTPGQGSPIHDHAEAHCIMKVLKGRLTETLYSWPCEASSEFATCSSSEDKHNDSPKHTCMATSDAPTRPAALEPVRRITFETDQVTYMSDKLGLHRIKNESTMEYAVSLHLYTPPNAAIYGCHIFDEHTGKRHHIQQCGYYSEMGHKTG